MSPKKKHDSHSEGYAGQVSLFIQDSKSIALSYARGLLSVENNDIAVQGNRVYLATYHGIHVHDRYSGEFNDEYYAGVNFWRCKMKGDTLIAGGKDLCVINHGKNI
jgi:hypothetical protein